MSRAAPKFIPDQARALFEILAPFGGIHLVYIHPKAPAVYGKHFERDVDAALAAAEKANADGLNVYWTVNAVRRHCDKKPTKGDITHARFVHVDIDPPKTGGKFDKDEINAALSDLNNPPSFVIDSGGGLNAYWRLDDPCENLSSIEGINLQVRDYFGADACQNIDRVMRVPGTINYPNAVKRSRGRSESQACWAIEDEGTVYDPAELAAAFPAATSATSADAAPIALPAHIEPQTPDTLGLGALDPIRLAISEPPGRDRSGDGVAAARLMANAGMTDEQIVGTLLNSENAVAAHYLDQRDPKRAAARTLQLVRADGPQSGEALHPDTPPMSSEDHATLLRNMKAKVRKGMELNEDKKPAPQISGEPKWLTELGEGGLAQFVRHVMATAPSPQPWVALGAAIATFGAIAGRRYCSPTGLRTNIYSIGICDSGGGKDHPLKAAKRLMIHSGLEKHVGGSKIASGQAMITDLTRSPNLLYPLDEVGFLLASAADRRRAPKHITDIIDNLTEFYSMAGDVFMGTSYADQSEKGKPRQVVDQPCLSLFGVTTPSVFWGSLKSDNVLDGSLARMLIFESENNYPDANHHAAQSRLPEPLLDLARAIDEGAEGHNPFPIGEGPSQTPNPYIVPYQDEAATAFAQAMRDKQISMLREHEGSNLTGIIARWAENAIKVAMVRSITDNPSHPVLSVGNLEWGMEVAKRSVETLMRAVKERVADNEYEGQLKFIQNLIINAGSAGLHSSQLSKDAKKVRARDRKDILAHLADAGLIRTEEVAQPAGKTGPKPFICYDIS